MIMKHLHTFEDFLNEAALNEIGEGGKNLPWNFDGYDDWNQQFNYTFRSSDKEYGLSFTWWSTKNAWDCEFGVKKFLNGKVDDIDMSILTGDGVFSIMSTVSAIFKDFLYVSGPKYEDEWNKPDAKSKRNLNRITFTPSGQFDNNDRKRLNLYMAYIKRQIS